MTGCILALTLCAQAATNVFDMPLLFPKHRYLQQQLMLTVRAGKVAEMETVCREGVALMPQDPTWQYNLACALAYRADKSESLSALEHAIDLGFRDAKSMRVDKDLKPLKDLPKFNELMGKAERLAGTPVEGAVQVRPSTVLMGMQAEIQGSNTVWNFDYGCFRALFSLMRPEIKRISGYASDYHGPAAETLRAWMLDESASGNFGDLYMNRDDGHSPLVVTNFPGLTSVVYCEEARQKRLHLSLPNTLFDQPVIGNSSMSMVNGPLWRSLPRAIVTDPYQAVFAFRFYLSNQSWFYPEHKDYDPEKGDLFPVNSPYYVISQGSSFSDQPFIRAFAATLAAFQPLTKRMLVTRKEVAPTLQMIFRATQKTVKKPEDYLTGAAHPVVFDVANLDVEAMVKLAHALKPEDAPPLVALRTLKDAQPVAGVDYFDTRPEGLFDTPFCIARVVRGLARQRSMTVEAKATSASQDDVKYVWSVLQGDPKKITIKPLNEAASQVEISVDYHGTYRPAGTDGTPLSLMSSRVDIGCFVKKGAYYSAPSFVSLYYLPNEERVYRDDGQILSVDYTNASHRYADPVLTLQKGWKDLYEYDEQGRLTGWYRTRSTGQPERFTSRGHKVVSTDKQNRPVKACAVEYMPRQTPGGDALPPTLTCVEKPEFITYTYTGDADRVGTAGKEPSKVQK
jgi:hypothetical protein